MKYYGHTKEDSVTKKSLPKEEWQLLKDHLEAVAALAEERAVKFGAKKLGRLAGLAHDIGKYSLEFQRRLEGSTQKVDHSTAGAQELYRQFGKMIGLVLAFVVAGHHGGMPDGHKGDVGNLPNRLSKEDIPDYAAYSTEITFPPIDLAEKKFLPKPKTVEMNLYSVAFFTRMLYSCLVDADYLDTERFIDVKRYEYRPDRIGMNVLFQRMQNKIAALSEKNRANPSRINQARQEILEQCLKMADSPSGLFTLTVPTGGGKTYSSLAFGLKHAVQHKKDRIIYVIPLTTISEQNAEVFREVLGDNAVLEHHSNFEYPDASFEEWDKKEKKHRLASENWDMPVVVTTTVQFFESLYANKGSRCRKLHNIANSVIILDEAQTLPLEYMRPCLWALAELVLNYEVTVVFCTATQPVVKPLFPGGLKATEIMEDPMELQRIFKRVTVQYRNEISDDELANAMADKLQVLTIVNTRRHARILFDKLYAKTREGVYHLSARMCPTHRKEILAEIRSALNDGNPCRVVSTQLIEAGVDVDFPCVYRSAAGIDSIAQAAGRCNREGRRQNGRVTVFEPEEPHGIPKKGRFALVAGLMRSTARRIHNFENDLMSLGAIEDYFRQLMDVERENTDAEGILKLIKDSGNELAFPFATIADKFQLIDSPTVSIVVPYDERAKRLMEEARIHNYPASLSRKLQPYTVQVYSYELAALEKERVVEKVGDIFRFITDSEFYDQQFGLKDVQEVKAPSSVLMF